MAQHCLTILALNELQLCADQVLSGGQDREKRQRADGYEGIRSGTAFNQGLVERKLDRLLGNADSAGGVPLRVCIEQEGTAFGDCERCDRCRSRSALVTVQLEDMIGMLEPVNLPGTSSEYSNWTRRMTASAREIFARTDVRELTAAMSAARKEPEMLIA